MPGRGSRPTGTAPTAPTPAARASRCGFSARPTDVPKEEDAYREFVMTHHLGLLVALLEKGVISLDDYHRGIERVTRIDKEKEGGVR
jgi:hypothetical protein